MAVTETEGLTAPQPPSQLGCWRRLRFAAAGAGGPPA